LDIRTNIILKGKKSIKDIENAWHFGKESKLNENEQINNESAILKENSMNDLRNSETHIGKLPVLVSENKSGPYKRPQSATVAPKSLQNFDNKAIALVKGAFVKKILDIKEYEIDFHYIRFIKVLFYHIGFFFFGQLFALLVMVPIEGWSYTSNLGYLGNKFMMILYQSLAHLVTISTVTVYFLLPTPSFTYGDILFLLVTVVMRCFIIAVRYGFMSESRYRLLYTKQTLIFVAGDFLYYSWVKCSPKQIELEIKATKFRCEIDEDFFYFTFTQDLPPKLEERLAKTDFYEDLEFEAKEFKKKIHKKKMALSKNKKTLVGDINYFHRDTLNMTLKDTQKTPEVKSFEE